MNEVVCLLSDVGKENIALAGGKGANLGELINAGCPVPDGFVVTTAAYDRFAAAHHLSAMIALVLRGETGAASVRSAFERGAMGPEIAGPILEGYRRLGEGAVAVRSSATAEDLRDAAFAGQQDTFLNVAGDEELLAAVRRVWASLWTDRALAYRRHMGLEDRAVKIAVVVQRMVAADLAGVMFTANPLTGARDEVVIDAGPGLGEAVASGLTTPDHYVLRGRSWAFRVVERRAGRHEVAVRPLPPPMPSRSLRRLARFGRSIERHFGAPQDVEWAWANRELFIVQARPITALPLPMPRATKPLRLLSSMFAEMFAVRPYPLDMTTWVPAISRTAVEPLFSLIGVAAPAIEQMFACEDHVVVEFSGVPTPRPTLGMLLAPFRWAWLVLRYDATRLRDDPMSTAARLRARVIAERDVRNLTWQGLIGTTKEAIALALPLAGEIRRRYYPRAFMGVALLRALLGILGRGKSFGALTAGAESKTLDANHAIERLAMEVRSDARLSELFAEHDLRRLARALEEDPAARAFVGELHAFLERYGHRELVLSTALSPTWKDAPDVVLSMIQGALSDRTGEGTRVEDQRRSAERELFASSLARRWPLHPVLTWLLATARSLWQVREDTHFDATLILPVLRRTLLELGGRLVASHAIESPEDVFHLTIDELENLGDDVTPQEASTIAAIVERRKARRAELGERPVVDPRFYREANADGDALLHGTPGSPGVAEGPACVIHDVSEFGKLRSGDVLVAPYTSPAWTPLFERAAAVIVDRGAWSSHAAIVAREYGIPAVMGTVEGTHRIADGQHVRVDGQRGLVFEAA